VDTARCTITVHLRPTDTATQGHEPPVSTRLRVLQRRLLRGVAVQWLDPEQSERSLIRRDGENSERVSVIASWMCYVCSTVLTRVEPSIASTVCRRSQEEEGEHQNDHIAVLSCRYAVVNVRDTPTQPVKTPAPEGASMSHFQVLSVPSPISLVAVCFSPPCSTPDLVTPTRPSSYPSHSTSNSASTVSRYGLPSRHHTKRWTWGNSASVWVSLM
jgi:hypothetical protein